MFDNVSVTHLAGARVYVDGVANSKALPVFLRNGASINCADAYFAEALSCVDGEEDTRIVASGNYTFKAIAGCPSITGSGTTTVSDELATPHERESSTVIFSYFPVAAEIIADAFSLILGSMPALTDSPAFSSDSEYRQSS